MFKLEIQNRRGRRIVWEWIGNTTPALGQPGAGSLLDHVLLTCRGKMWRITRDGPHGPVVVAAGF
jgi:hypothetical protein